MPPLCTINIKSSRITVVPSAEIKKSRAIREDLFFEYEDGIDLGKLPQHVLWLPAIFNLAPLVWALGLRLSVPFRCKELESGLRACRTEFSRLYPGIDWSGEVEFGGEEVAERSAPTGPPLAMFSGGLDSTHTEPAFHPHKDLHAPVHVAQSDPEIGGGGSP